MADFVEATPLEIEEVPPYDLTIIPAEQCTLETLKSSDAREMLLQWNIDQTLQFQKFRFTGAFDRSADYDKLVKDFFRNSACMASLGVTGTPNIPLVINMHELSTSVTSMNFFDRLNENDICHNGHIRGCFEDVFDGMTVNDKLREMLINEESEVRYDTIC